MHIDKVKERLSELARISEEGAKLHPEDSEMFITDKEALETALKHIDYLQKKNEELVYRTIQYDKTLEKLQKDTVWKKDVIQKINDDAFQVDTREYGNIEVVSIDSLNELIS